MAEDPPHALRHSPCGLLGVGEVPGGRGIPDLVADRREPAEDDGQKARHVAERCGAALGAGRDGFRWGLGGRFGDGAKRLGVETRVPEGQGGGVLEGRREGRPAGSRAANREERDQPLVHGQRQDGPQRGAEAAGESRVSRDVLGGNECPPRDRHRIEREGGARRPGVVRQTRSSCQDEAVAIGQEDRHRLGSEAGCRLRRHDGGGPGRIETGEEPGGRHRLPCPLGLAEEGRTQAIARHDQRADRIGLERNRPPPPDQEGAGRPAGGGMNRDRQCGAEAVMLEQGVGSAQARARLHDLVGMDGPPDDAVVRAGLERQAEALLSEDGQRALARQLEDRGAIGAGVREGAVDREEAGLGSTRAAADGQETLESGEAGAGRLVEQGAGRSVRGRNPDGVGQRVEAASDGGEGVPDVAERPVLGAHGREYRNRPGRGQRAVRPSRRRGGGRSSALGLGVLSGRSGGHTDPPAPSSGGGARQSPSRTSAATKTRRRPPSPEGRLGRRRSNERRSYFLSVRM